MDTTINAGFADIKSSLLKTDGKYDNLKVTGTTAAVAGITTLEILWLINSPWTFVIAHATAIIAADLGYTIGKDLAEARYSQPISVEDDIRQGEQLLEKIAADVKAEAA